MRLAVLLQLVAALHVPDAAHLRYVSARAGVDYRVVLADAWQETGRTLNTRVRDHSCWYSYTDSTGIVTHHERDCAVGRFQIRPSTARRNCPGKNVFTYRGNVDCFIEMFGTNARAVGVERALFIHNHSRAYVNEILATVGRIAVAEDDNVTSQQAVEEQPLVLDGARSGHYSQQSPQDREARADGTGVAGAPRQARAILGRDSSAHAQRGRQHGAADAIWFGARCGLLMFALLLLVISPLFPSARRRE